MPTCHSDRREESATLQRLTAPRNDLTAALLHGTLQRITEVLACHYPL
jgi:hypothetical protein